MLFELQQAVDRYDSGQQISQCDQRLQKYLAALPSRTILDNSKEVSPPIVAEKSNTTGGDDQAQLHTSTKKKKRSKPRDNEPNFALEAELTGICGVDLSTIDGVKVMTIQTFVAELGTDMSRWATEDHLVSWLKLAPNRQISGGKVIKQQRNQTTNRVSPVLRTAARQKRKLSRRTLPPVARTPGSGQSHKSYGGLFGTADLPDAHARTGLGRSRSRVERETHALLRKATALGYRLEPAA